MLFLVRAVTRRSHTWRSRLCSAATPCMEMPLSHILVCAVPSPGHVQPMLAAAELLKTLGHDVTFHTGEQFRGQAESADVRFISLVGSANYDYRVPISSHDYRHLAGNDHKVHLVRGRFAETIPDQHRRLQEILRDTPVDLIVTGSMFLGAFPLLLGPRQKRPPIIGCGVNPLMLTSRDCARTRAGDGTAEVQRLILEDNGNFVTAFQPVTDHINSILRACGAAPMPHALFIDAMYLLPDLFVQFSAEEFELPRSDTPETIRFAGPLMPRRSTNFVEPAWWSELDGTRPVVLVTQGTIANQDMNELIQPTFSGLADEDVLVIGATGRGDTQTIAVPANAKAASHIPFDRLLPKVDVFVTNGGYGAVNHALGLGVPIVVAGETEDKNFVAARIEWSGAGINLKTRYATAEQVRNAVLAVLADRSYRQQARRLQSIFARYDAPRELARAVDWALSQGSAATRPHAPSVYTH